MVYDINRFHFVALITWQFSNFHASQLLLPIFTNYVPQWRCGNSTFGSDCAEFKKCNGSVEFKDIEFYSAALEFDWICDRHYYATLLAQCQFFGVLIGTISFGMLSDIFGRRPGAILLCTLGIAATVCSALASNQVVYFAARLLVGISGGGAFVTMYTYINELILPQQRMVLRGVFNWGMSRIIMAILCFVVGTWRYATLGMASGPTIVLFLVIFYFTESPIWLHSKNRIEEMVECEKTIAKRAGVPYVPQEHKKAVRPKTLWQVLRDPVMFRRLAVLWVMWFTGSSSGYAIDLNSNTLSGNLYLNQIIIAIMIYISKLILLTVDTHCAWFTRRVLHQGSQIGALICFAVLFGLTYFKYQGVLFLIFTILGTVLIEYTWDAYYLCTVESLETSARASGSGSCSFVARLGGLMSPVLASMNHVYPGAMYVAVIGMGILCLTVSCLFLEETKGIKLDREEERESTDDMQMKEKAEKSK